MISPVFRPRVIDPRHTHYDFQYAISEDETWLPRSFDVMRFENWLVARDPKLPVTRILDSNGTVCSLFLGWVFYKGKLASDTIDIDKELLNISTGEFLEHFIGRYVLLHKYNNLIYFSFDCAGALPAVFSEKRKTIASTVNLIPFDENSAFQSELLSIMGFPNNGAWLPFGLTSRTDVKRLLPNHALELDSFKRSRIWPCTYIEPLSTDSSVKFEEDLAALSRTLAETIVANVRTLSALNPAIHLTAGRDTRMLLAASRSICEASEYMTLKLPGASHDIDSSAASKLARKLSLKHRFVPYVEPKRETVERWFEQTGWCVADSVSYLGETLQQIADHDFFMSGIGAETGRSLYWSAADIGKKSLRAEQLLNRLKLPIHKATLDGANDWLRDLPAGPDTWILDMALVEQKRAARVSAFFYGHADLVPSFSPFLDRKVFSLMFQLPLHYRADQKMGDDLVEICWPEALTVPYNKAEGVLRLKCLPHELVQAIPPKVKYKLHKLALNSRVEKRGLISEVINRLVSQFKSWKSRVGRTQAKLD